MAINHQPSSSSLIEAGRLFIAQPPLYKVKHGQQERILKDERRSRTI